MIATCLICRQIVSSPPAPPILGQTPEQKLAEFAETVLGRHLAEHHRDRLQQATTLIGALSVLAVICNFDSKEELLLQHRTKLAAIINRATARVVLPKDIHVFVQKIPGLCCECQGYAGDSETVLRPADVETALQKFYCWLMYEDILPMEDTAT